MVSESLYWQANLDGPARSFFSQSCQPFWQVGEEMWLGCHCRPASAHALVVESGSWVTWSEGRFYLGLPQ